jgi:phosphodiesterase/alkaline phosphatase D-like protein
MPRARFKGDRDRIFEEYRLGRFVDLMLTDERQPVQVDAWDGYGYERKQILDFILDHNVHNVVAITGDIHTFFAGTAYTTGDRATGRAALPEFVGGSATSTGLPEATGLSPTTQQVLAVANPHIDFYDFVKRGTG